jgi:membrane associated rhomboid family serine protease
MIPLKDLAPRRSVPFVTFLLILANVLVFLYQLSLGPRAGQEFAMIYGEVPYRTQLALTGELPLSVGFVPFFTSMFLHGGWLHIIGNMWFLWIFGDNVEDQLGHFPYLVFYLICGLGSGLAQTIFNWGSKIPAIGASVAISGVLGAYVVLFPRARILTLIPIFILFYTVELPAVVFIGLWFLLQFLSGLGALQTGSSGGVAWWAHVGGFLLGIILVKTVFPPNRAAVYYS